VRGELFHADGGTNRQTGMTKLIVACHNFANAAKQTSQLMLHSEIISVCSEIHTQHINTPCGQNVELPIVKLAMVPLDLRGF
jgi:hypothetical protein